ncbi:MAG: DUF4956 domain-containing protein [Bacteroidia bacterium]|nr:DUF4956 domain-containing protein [Bacteroidia bacterium]
MFELFSDGPAYEYPQLINVTYSFLWAFLLSSLIAITHRLTFTGDYYPKNLFQSFILGALVTALIMMAIGDSLARGLGVFGAMAIIRFRTRIDDPRDVLFLFAALSTGLAIGVFGYTISFTGTILFCAVAFLLHYSPFRSVLHQQRLHFTLSNSNQLSAALLIIDNYCPGYRQLSAQVNKENKIRYQFGVSVRKGMTSTKLIDELGEVEGIELIRLSINEIVTN